MKRIIGLFAIFLAGCGNTEMPTAQTAAPQQTVQGPVVFIGDSITAYWPIQSYLPGAIDVGVGGQTSVQMLARFNTDVLSHHPSIVVILAGTNDIRVDQSADPSSLFQMVEMAEAAGTHVIVGNLPPNQSWYYDPVQGQALYVQFDAEIQSAVASLGFTLADYRDAMSNSDGSQNTALFNSDGVHPNAAGYDVMWGILKPLLVADGVSL